MFSYGERQEIVDMLVIATPAGTPRETFVAILGDRLKGKLNASGPVNDLAAQTIGLCFDNPPALLAVFDHLIDHAEFLARATEFRARYTRDLPPSGNPFDDLILGARVAFADRAPLRAILRDMSADGSAPLLVVEGDPETGKSFVSELVDHYCERTRNAVFCKVAVKPKQGADAGPLEIAKDLVTQLGGDPSAFPPQTSNREAWYPELANWVLGRANALASDGTRVWFVIDGFRAGVMREDAGKFLLEFASRALLGVSARRHRLVISDFAETERGKLPTKQKSYRTEPVRRDHVAAVVAEIVAATAAIPAGDKDAVATAALDKVLAGHELPLRSLNIVGGRLRRLIEEARL